MPSAQVDNTRVRPSCDVSVGSFLVVYGRRQAGSICQPARKRAGGIDRVNRSRHFWAGQTDRSAGDGTGPNISPDSRGEDVGDARLRQNCERAGRSKLHQRRRTGASGGRGQIDDDRGCLWNDGRGCLWDDDRAGRPNDDRGCLREDDGAWRPIDDRGRARFDDGGDRRGTDTMAVVTGPAFTRIGRAGSNNDRRRSNHHDGNDGVRS